MEIGKAQTARELQKTLQSVTTQTIYSGVTGICGAGEQNRCWWLAMASTKGGVARGIPPVTRTSFFCGVFWTLKL